MAVTLRKTICVLPTLFGLAANETHACGTSQAMVSTETPETPVLSQVVARAIKIGADEDGEPVMACAFVVYPDDPRKLVTGTIDGGGAEFDFFRDGSSVTLFANGSTYLYSPTEERSELQGRQDKAAKRAVSSIAKICHAPTI
jgi:hypothetical protein